MYCDPGFFIQRIFVLFRNYCSPGYFGLFCADFCPYPFYGKYCDYKCTCSKQRCSHVDGCIPSNYNYTNFILILVVQLFARVNSHSLIYLSLATSTLYVNIKNRYFTQKETQIYYIYIYVKCLQWLIWPFLCFKNMNVKNRDTVLIFFVLQRKLELFS